MYYVKTKELHESQNRKVKIGFIGGFNKRTFAITIWGNPIICDHRFR